MWISHLPGSKHLSILLDQNHPVSVSQKVTCPLSLGVVDFGVSLECTFQCGHLLGLQLAPLQKHNVGRVLQKLKSHLAENILNILLF